MVTKKISEMSAREMRVALMLQRISLRAIAEACVNFAETSKNAVTVAEFQAIGEQAQSDADRYT